MIRFTVAVVLMSVMTGCRLGDGPGAGETTGEPPAPAVEGEPRTPTEPDRAIKTVPRPDTEAGKKEESSMKMTVRKATKEEIEKLGVKSWPIWTYDPEARPPAFDWHYDSREICYIIEGEVTVEAEGQKITFGPGDIVEFPSGLDCVWKVDKAVRKHYKFE